MIKMEINGKRRMWRGENRGWTPTYIVDEYMCHGLYHVVYRGTDKANAEAYLQGKENEYETRDRFYEH